MEGWISIANSRKFHYCIGNMTICNKFMYLGGSVDGKWDGNYTDDDCAACVKKLQRRDKIGLSQKENTQ